MIMDILIYTLVTGLDVFLDKLQFKNWGKVNHMFSFILWGMVLFTLYKFFNFDGASICAAVGVRMLLFDPLFNRLVINKPTFYVGKTAWTDRIKRKLNLVGWPGYSIFAILGIALITNRFITQFNF